MAVAPDYDDDVDDDDDDDDDNDDDDDCDDALLCVLIKIAGGTPGQGLQQTQPRDSISTKTNEASCRCSFYTSGIED